MKPIEPPPLPRMTFPAGSAYPRSRTAPTAKPLYGFLRWGQALYFFNHAPYCLDHVSIDRPAVQQVDDTVVIAKYEPLVYENVKPDEGVLLDEYELFVDDDWMISVHVNVSSPVRGMETFGASGKGGPPSIVLLWDDGFISPRVMHSTPASS